MRDDQPIPPPGPSEAINKRSSKGDKRSSKGDKLFDGLVDGLLNYTGTFVLTLGIARALKHGWGAAMVEKGTKKLGNFLGRFNLEKHAETAVTTSILMPGGSLMLIPLHYLEGKRQQIVGYFNRQLGDTTDPSQLIEPPKQTWGSLIKGRLVAWMVVFGSLTGLSSLVGGARFAELEENFAKNLVCKPLGKATHTPLGAETEVFQYGKLAAVDVFATAASTALLYVSSRFFAKKRDEKQQLRALANGSAISANDNDEIMDDGTRAAPAASAENPSTKVSRPHEHTMMRAQEAARIV